MEINNTGLRDDQRKVFKIMYGYYNTDKEQFWNLQGKVITRGHSKVLMDSQKYEFSHKIVS